MFLLRTPSHRCKVCDGMHRNIVARTGEPLANMRPGNLVFGNRIFLFARRHRDHAKNPKGDLKFLATSRMTVTFGAGVTQVARIAGRLSCNPSWTVCPSLWVAKGGHLGADSSGRLTCARRCRWGRRRFHLTLCSICFWRISAFVRECGASSQRVRKLQSAELGTFF